MMEMETRRFYETSLARTTDAAIRQLLGDLAEEERKHTRTAEALAPAGRGGRRGGPASGCSSCRWSSRGWRG